MWNMTSQEKLDMNCTPDVCSMSEDKLDDPKPATLSALLKRVHEDQRGAVSLETILIIGAIALPILIFLIKVGWPRIKNYFNKGLDDLEESSDNAILN